MTAIRRWRQLLIAMTTGMTHVTRIFARGMTKTSSWSTHEPIGRMRYTHDRGRDELAKMMAAAITGRIVPGSCVGMAAPLPG